MRALIRYLRHLCSTSAGTRVTFSSAVCARIEAAITAAETSHMGEIRFVVETALPFTALWHGISARARALQLFAQLHVWDTEHNNGVLIYVLRADRALEIIADRGISARVAAAEWQQICRQIESQFAVGRYGDGACAAIAAVALVLQRHFPARSGGRNELPNQPILL